MYDFETRRIMRATYRIAEDIVECEDYMNLDIYWFQHDVIDFNSRFQELSEVVLGGYADHPTEMQKCFRALALLAFAADMYKRADDTSIMESIETIVSNSIEQYAVNWSLLTIEKNTVIILDSECMV